jgi:hypothetical protein
MTLEVAADRWNPAETNAMTAAKDIVDSEQGLLWVGRDGGLTFKNRHHLFKRVADAPDVTVDNVMTEMDAEISAESVFNRIVVSYTPRSTTQSGVIAKAHNVIAVPPGGVLRYNPSDPITPDMTVVTLPGVDPETGRLLGIASVDLPLVAGTNYTVNDRTDGSGFDYTHTGRIQTAVAINGSSVEVSFTNSATGTLYVRGLQLTGTMYVAYDEQQIILDDPASQEAYGRRPLAVALPFSSENVSTFAALLAQYLLSRYSAPTFEARTLTFQDFTTIGPHNLYAFDIGHVVALSEDQTGIASAKYLITGLSITAEAGQRPTTTWRLRSLDQVTYWILEDSTYGKLGQTTRLAL